MINRGIHHNQRSPDTSERACEVINEDGLELDDVEISISTLAPTVPKIEATRNKVETWVHLCTRTPVDATKNSPSFPTLLCHHCGTSENIWPGSSGSIRCSNTSTEPGPTFNDRFLILATRCLDKRVNGYPIIKSVAAGR